MRALGWVIAPLPLWEPRPFVRCAVPLLRSLLFMRAFHHIVLGEDGRRKIFGSIGEMTIFAVVLTK